LLLSGGRRHTKREGKRHNRNNAPYRHGLAYYLPHFCGERTMQLWISLDSENMLPTESPIWTYGSRIVPFFCPRHNEFAIRARHQMPRDDLTAKSFHEKAGLSQAGFVVSVEWSSMEPIRHCRHPSIRTLC
jgi:hypothetical protein